MSATAQQEVDSLDRVLTRLATTEETNLEKVGVEVTQARLPDHTVLEISQLNFIFFKSGYLQTDLLVSMTAGAEQIITCCAWAVEVPSRTHQEESESAVISTCTILAAQISCLYRAQVLEMLSHVNKRVRGHDQIKLPLDALLDLYLTDASAPLVKNFAIVYVEMAMERSTEDQQAAAVSIDSCSCFLLTCVVALHSPSQVVTCTCRHCYN